MRREVSLYAPEPGAPGVAASSGTGVFVSGLVRMLKDADRLALRIHWLRPAPLTGAPGAAGWTAGFRWLGAEVRRLLGDPAGQLILVYPNLPIVESAEGPGPLAAARRTLQALRARHAVTGQRTDVVVSDLPIEMARGRERAGAPPARIDERGIRRLESTVFRGAHRLIVPEGFMEPIREHHGVPGERFRTFRRHVYLPEPEPGRDASLAFEGGSVDFFYSGSVDPQVAPNFREVLRSIRNAPETRLHVCGPGRDSVREWLEELDVPNVRHYGQLAVAEHDWLARQCDVGLILYPSDNPYNHLRPTMKYSAYVANGLAVLATDLERVAENVRRDGVGLAMPIRELAMEMLRWATRPKLWAEAKRAAEAQALGVRSGGELRAWIEELARPRTSDQ